MRHIQQCTRRIPLHAHIPRLLRQPHQRNQRTTPRNRRLIRIVRGKVGDAADSVALHLDIRTEHHAHEGFETVQVDDFQFVGEVDGEVAEGGGCGALYFHIGRSALLAMVFEQVEKRFENGRVDFLHV